MFRERKSCWSIDVQQWVTVFNPHTHLLVCVCVCVHIMCYFGSFPWPLTLAPERCKCPKNIMAAFLCKNTAVKEDNWGCHDDGLQQADGAVFVCRTSNGIKALSAPHRRLWFELGTEFQSLSSNSRSIWNTPLQKKGENGEKDPESRGPDRPRDLDFIRDNYLICFISMLPPRVGRQTSGLCAVWESLQLTRGLWTGSLKHCCPRCSW